MEGLFVLGGKSLHGEITINGAKNAVLPILAATVLHGGTYVLDHCPDIADVRLACEIVTYLGGSVTRQGKTLTVRTESVHSWQIPSSLMEKMRASVLFLGPLLARFGRAVLTMPGGCPLGQRPIDLHLRALAQMGAAISFSGNQIICEAPRLKGCALDLPFPSVGATENILLAAMGTDGTVSLRGAAREPEIGDLMDFLRAMGGSLAGDGTGCLQMEGSRPLHDARYTILPDRIETATYLCAAAACGGDVCLHRAVASHLLPVVESLEQAGCRIARTEDGVRIWSDGHLRAVGSVETAPYPGFPTDAQAILAAAMLRAEGTTVITEHIFSSRMGHVAQLRRFGAQIEADEKTAVIRGVRQLHPALVQGCDLRATAALVVAALQVPGESCITGLKHLHRGYDSFEEQFKTLGACLRQTQ